MTNYEPDELTAWLDWLDIGYHTIVNPLGEGKTIVIHQQEVIVK